MNVAPYVSALAVEIATLAPASGHTEIEGSWAFFDLSGFTRLSERLAGLGAVGAELLKETLNTVFHELIEEARIVGGDVVKFGGDAFLVVFRGEGHADRAAEVLSSASPVETGWADGSQLGAAARPFLQLQNSNDYQPIRIRPQLESTRVHLD